MPAVPVPAVPVPAVPVPSVPVPAGHPDEPEVDGVVVLNLTAGSSGLKDTSSRDCGLVAQIFSKQDNCKCLLAQQVKICLYCGRKRSFFKVTNWT